MAPTVWAIVLTVRMAASETIDGFALEALQPIGLLRVALAQLRDIRRRDAQKNCLGHRAQERKEQRQHDIDQQLSEAGAELEGCGWTAGLRNGWRCGKRQHQTGGEEYRAPGA